MAEVTVNIIRTEADYEEALSRLDEIFDAEPGTPQGDEAHILTILIKEYENQLPQSEAADPVDVIKFVMEQQDLKQADLAPIMGGKNRVSEVLNRKRALTLEMIRNLNRTLHIPIEALIGV